MELENNAVNLTPEEAVILRLAMPGLSECRLPVDELHRVLDDVRALRYTASWYLANSLSLEADARTVLAERKEGLDRVEVGLSAIASRLDVQLISGVEEYLRNQATGD